MIENYTNRRVLGEHFRVPALRERERNKKGVRLGLSEFIDFNYFNKAKYFDFKDIKLPYFHCGLSNSMEEKFP